MRFPYASYLAELAFRIASPEVAGKIWPLLISGLKGIAKHPHPRIAVKAARLAPNLEGRGLYLLDGERVERGGVYLELEGLRPWPPSCVCPAARPSRRWIACSKPCWPTCAIPCGSLPRPSFSRLLM